jgi:integrase
MIKLRPWKGSKHEFEVDVIVNSAQGRTLRRRVKAPVTGKSNAERWAKSLEQELLAQLLAPEPEPEKPPAPTFEEFATIFLDLCKADRLGVNTLMNYDVHLRHYLVPVLARRRLDEVKPSDITAIKSSLSDKSHNTMCEVLKTLRRVFNRAIMAKLIERTGRWISTSRAGTTSCPSPTTSSEQAALLAAAQTLGPMYVALVVLGFDGGLRRGEILGLQWSDLDFKRMLMVRPSQHRPRQARRPQGPDRGRGRHHPPARRRPHRRSRARAPSSSTTRGSHYKDHNIKTWLTTLLRYAGLPWQGTHILRKTCGTRIADNGGGVSAVASHLRHKNLQTASRYIDRRGGTSRALKALES